MMETSELASHIEKLESDIKQQEKEFINKEKEILINTFVVNLKLIASMKEKDAQLSQSKEAIKNLKITNEKKLKEFQLNYEKIEKKLSNKEKKQLVKVFKNYLIMMGHIRRKEEKISELDKAINNRRTRISRVSNKKHKEIYELNKRIKTLKKELLFWDEEKLMQDHALYNDRFNFSSSLEYKEKLDRNRKKQKELIKQKQATLHNTNWTINGNRRKGNTQNNKNIRLTLIAFNQQCDNVIAKVKYNNIPVCERQMKKAYKDINELNKYDAITITDQYLNLKLDELYLSYEYAQKRQLEKEEQERIKELIREDKRVEKELEEQLAKLNKEEKHLKNALNEEIAKLDEIGKKEIESRLEEIKKQKEEVDYRVKNERAGYVYVTSNIGSFGENVYKIGMTRRLNPIGRIKELSGAAVPFPFDIHAFIFSDDAPALEATLHRTFDYRRINKVNNRKEFFRVSLKEIERIVHQNHNAKIEFTLLAEAREFRETLKKRNEIA